MKYTSAEAAKLLRQLKEKHQDILLLETESRSFIASLGEDVDSVRPEYDYESIQQNLAELEIKIRKVKHAINRFNITHVVPGFDITVDQMLVLIPQLSEKKSKLSSMKSLLPKSRIFSRTSGSNIIDYRYANYDIKKVESDYNEVSEMLSKAQTALDVLNNTETMDIDL
ncbi:MAG: hypothetical protein ACI4WS_01895 [Oscillospiraceae bacterium]